MGIISDAIGKAIDTAGKFIPDETAKLQMQADLQKMAIDGENQLVQAQAGIVKTEAASTGFLASSWRPILMLTFGWLIVARWMGFSAPNLSETEVLELWSIVKVGIGGYVVGRSVEKIVPSIAAALSSGGDK